LAGVNCINDFDIGNQVNECVLFHLAQGPG
jgi:hypothetical protein